MIDGLPLSLFKDRLKPTAYAGYEMLYQVYPNQVGLQAIADTCKFGGYRARLTEIRDAIRPYGWTIEQKYIRMAGGFLLSAYSLRKLQGQLFEEAVHEKSV